MEVVYIAEDGTKFADEDDCLYYEQRIKAEIKFKNAKAWDSDRKPVSISDIYAHYYYVPSDVDAVEFFDYIYDIMVDSDLTYCAEKAEYKAGYYFFDSDEQIWYFLDDYIAELNEKANKFGYTLKKTVDKPETLWYNESTK